MTRRSRARVMARVTRGAQAAQPSAPAWLSWAWSAGIAVAVLLVLWILVQPGIALEWSVEPDGLSTFQIYRAPAGSSDYRLVSQVPAQSSAQAYTLVDVLVLPWQTYVYRVEGVSQQGQVAYSPAITSSAWDVLPYQLAILLVSLAAGYVAMALARRRPWFGPGVLNSLA